MHMLSRDEIVAGFKSYEDTTGKIEYLEWLKTSVDLTEFDIDVDNLIRNWTKVKLKEQRKAAAAAAAAMSRIDEEV